MHKGYEMAKKEMERKSVFRDLVLNLAKTAIKAFIKPRY